MLNDKITVMVLPRDRGEVRQLSIPIRLLWTIGVCGVCFVLVNMFLLADYFDQRVDRARMAKLIDENAMLSEQYTALEETIDILQNDYGVLVSKEEAIRDIFDLPAIDSETRMLGIGGPTDPDLASATPATATAMEISAEVDKLLRLSGFERERYQEIYDKLQEKRDLLDHTPSIMPTRGYFSRGYGYKNDPFTGFRQFHPGLDIANKTGTPILATADGKVISARINGGLGKMIVIDHGYGYKTRYGHLSAYKVKVGQRVKRGNIIADMGNTGYSTGPHLHYEVIKNGKAVNAYKYIINKK
ncbi:MAG: M23 family metallopeptidase [FCB group bacterium]|nr:M23 family metallopeptidase [FCB group bacterium]